MADIGEDAPSTPTKRGKERVRSDSVSTRSDITSETTPSEVATPSTVAEAVRSIAAAKYDRYGFKIEDESKETEKERRRRFETENRRLVKWMKMMGGDGENWDLYKRKHMDKVKERVRKGLPDAIRGLGWRIFAHSGSLQEKNKGLYEHLCVNGSAPNWEPIITRDLNRTFPSHINFESNNARGGQGQQALFNVLKAVAVYDKRLGYCQGLGFVAGILLIYMSEEESFWVLIRMIRDYDMEGLFLPGFPGLQKKFFMLRKFLEARQPDIVAHFDKEGLMPDIYAMQWFQMLFSYNFPFALVLRIWDVFLAEKSWKVIFRVALHIIVSDKDKLLSSTFENLAGRLKSANDRLLKVDPDKFMTAVNKVALTSREIDAAAAEYEREFG
mmetsp:Transcript_26249/g.66752  ORF Transcript_26249/g.66752 Transcript_26249/m.66752 type:complete len:385 (+) Transcript_26249:153-1307(+)